MLAFLFAADPGLNRLRSAVQSVVTIGAAMAAEWGFVLLTHAMQLDTHGVAMPPAAAAQVAAQHHGVTVIAVMIGAVVGMIAAFTGGMFPSTGQLLRGYVSMPVFMVAGLALGLSLGHHRTVSLMMLVVILAGGAYLRRYGPLGFVIGQMIFMGDFFGFFLDGAVELKDIGWLAAEIALGTAVALIAQFTLFYPGRRAALTRMQRSYEARRRDLVDHAIRMLDEPAQAVRMQRTLHRKTMRLNETALIIDGQLNHPGAIPAGWSAETLHQILFDVELAVSNLSRFTGYLATLEVSSSLSPEARAAVRTALVAVRDGDLEAADAAANQVLQRFATADGPESLRVVLHRLGLSVLGFADAQRRLREGRRLAALGAAGSPDASDTAALGSPVVLMAGWLPGSAMVSAQASTEVDTDAEARPLWRRALLGHVALTPNVRVAVQMAVAVGASIAIGEVLSGRRFYWAVIAAFVTFMGANNATEQVRKSINRVIGTAIGAVIGGLLAHLVGTHSWIAVGVILASIFFGIYFMRVSYAFMVVGITVMVSQLYVQLDEFSNSFLVLRLEETALGAAIAAVTVVCVLPLRTGRVVRLTGRAFLSAVDEVVDEAVRLLLRQGSAVALRAAVRRMDDAYQSLTVVAASLGKPLFERGDTARDQFLAAAAAARNYARNLLVDTPDAVVEGEHGLDAARERFSASVGALTRWLDTEAHDAAYIRSASLFDRVAASAAPSFGDPLDLTLRDLELLDGALAAMADTVSLRVRALDGRAALTPGT